MCHGNAGFYAHVGLGSDDEKPFGRSIGGRSLTGPNSPTGFSPVWTTDDQRPPESVERDGAPPARCLLWARPMPHESLGDPTMPIGRWVLNACAKVNRESPDQAEYIGLLMSDPEVGAPLVLAIDGRQRLTTSTVQRIEPGPNDSLYVHTRNSLYWVRRLSQLGRSK